MKLEQKEDVYVLIGQNIRNCRKHRSITQDVLANKAGISRASLVQIEAGKQRLPIHLLYALAEALGAPLQEIVVEFPRDAPDTGARLLQAEAKNIMLQEENRYLRMMLDRIRRIVGEVAI